MRGNDFKLKEGWFRIDIRKKIFTMVRNWHSLPREAVTVPCLKVWERERAGLPF